MPSRISADSPRARSDNEYGFFSDLTAQAALAPTDQVAAWEGMAIADADIAIRSRSCSGASKTGPHPHPL
jgi:hypothetical protein